MYSAECELEPPDVAGAGAGAGGSVMLTAVGAFIVAATSSAEFRTTLLPAKADRRSSLLLKYGTKP